MGSNVQFALGKLAGALATISRFRAALIGIPGCDHIVGTWGESAQEDGFREGTLAYTSMIRPGRGLLDVEFCFEHCPLCGKYLD